MEKCFIFLKYQQKIIKNYWMLQNPLFFVLFVCLFVCLLVIFVVGGACAFSLQWPWSSQTNSQWRNLGVQQGGSQGVGVRVGWRVGVGWRVEVKGRGEGGMKGRRETGDQRPDLYCDIGLFYKDHNFVPLKFLW